MLHINRIRENKLEIVEQLKVRNVDFSALINEIIELDEIRRNSQHSLDQELSELNQLSKKIGELFIDEVNQVFDTNAEFFQIYIHSDAETNELLDTSGAVSGRGTISAVYTMPMEETESMYGKLSSMLISSSIRENGGFYEVAKTLATDPNAKMSFSIIPTESKTLLQLKLSTTTPIENEIKTGTEINPLGFFKINELTRSNYFSTGNYPLNSIFQIIILANEETNFSNVQGNILQTQNIDGIEMPTEFSKEGWIFDPLKGEQIQGKFIFGERDFINEDELKFSLGEDNIKYEEIQSDDSIIVVAIIAIVSIGAAIFYLKGYKK